MSEEVSSRVGQMFGPYHLKRLLGRGGMGEVYEAYHTTKEWAVAVKLMSESFSKDQVFRERMKREARITGRLQEPHVVPIHDYGEIDGQLFLEMRLIEGVDLDSVLKRFGPMTPARAVAIITQIASALDAAHAAGVMHRDVKPQNILVTREDFAYLVDFGIASATTDEKLTQLGTAVGTWKYMAPERFSNSEVTYKADIYALACVLHECLTGAPPYRADSASVLVTAHLMDPIPQPSSERSGIPRGFDSVIARGMAKKPEDRYASAGDLAQAAQDALSNRDQDDFETILRRSTEATTQIPQAPARTVTDPPTVTPQPQPTVNLHGSGPTVQPAPTPYPNWSANSGPRPVPGQPGTGQIPPSGINPPVGAVPPQQFYPGGGGNWGGQPPIAPPLQPPNIAPWPGQPPPKKRSPWPIIAAVAVGLVVIAGVIVLVLVLIPSPKPPPPPLAQDKLDGLLLSTSDVNNLMGATNMEPGKPLHDMDSSSVNISNSDCRGALYPTQDVTYSGSGYTSVSETLLAEKGDNKDHYVDQAVVLFPTADKAKALAKTATDNWKPCDGKTITVTTKEAIRWNLSQVEGQLPKVTLNSTQEGAKGWGCQRALGVANNVVIDIKACAYHIDTQGSQLIDKITDKINSTQ